MINNNKFFTILILFSFVVLLSQKSNAQNYSYEPAEGKIMGVWPHNDRFKSVENLKELKEKWGFDHLLIPEIYEKNTYKKVMAAGYDSMKIMYQIVTPNFLNQITTFKRMLREIHPVGYYYFDEPISRKQGFTRTLQIIKLLSEMGYYPKAKVIFSELTVEKALQFRRIGSQIMYSGYGNKGVKGQDQIGTWNQWKDNLGDKFTLLWIGSHEDYEEYDELFKAAAELGMKGVWFYMLEPLGEGLEADEANITSFCEAAVKYGFMNRK
jgi:hypothetical protein